MAFAINGRSSSHFQFGVALYIHRIRLKARVRYFSIVVNMAKMEMVMMVIERGEADDGDDDDYGGDMMVGGDGGGGWWW